MGKVLIKEEKASMSGKEVRNKRENRIISLGKESFIKKEC
ncbi:hypothetical protein ES707_06888 [subsurface metagenome]|jgi:hypothetical protein